jgi:hypothetical protein
VVGRTESATVVDSSPFRAVGGNGIYGIPAVLGADQDRFDHAIAPIGAIASAGFAICHVGLDEPGSMVSGRPEMVICG